jgi:predicted dehydrogenase
MSKPVSVIIVGGGSRGQAYASYLNHHPGAFEIVGLCEKKDDRRAWFADKFKVPAEGCFNDWQALLNKPRLADAAFICTVEDLHRDIAVALASKGYHLMLEKPMAPTQEACVDIYRAAREHGIILAVCHVLRYTAFFNHIKNLIDSGLIGTLHNITATEYVGPWHFTHSFVRGNYGNEKKSSPVLLAKCCHDLDLLNWFAGSRCVKTASFGRLSYFNRAHQPKGAADRCTACPPEIESSCPYSALKIYMRDRHDRLHAWPVNMLTVDTTPAGVAKALREGPYGRCVYACDNDVCDHQVVDLEFASGMTASFVTTSFAIGSRDYFYMGDKGTLRLNDNGLEHFDFLTFKSKKVEVNVGDGTTASGHGGGDDGVVTAFLEAVRKGDPAAVKTGPDVSLESHLIVFAAERARKNGRVEPVPVVSDLIR